MQSTPQFLFDPPQTPSVAIYKESMRFPVRRVFCVGCNYAAHAAEMGTAGDAPIFFSKPSDALVDSGFSIPYPPLTKKLQHEAELVVAIQKPGRNIPMNTALDHVYGYAIGNDLTRRDLQLTAKNAGKPWDQAKGFDHSAVCGPIHPVSEVGHLDSGIIQLTVNNQLRQHANLETMIWPVPKLIHLFSCSVELQPGDLIYSGTPQGVGDLQIKDICTVQITGLGEITNQITALQI